MSLNDVIDLWNSSYLLRRLNNSNGTCICNTDLHRKIINIGFMKCGTLSLRDLFNKLKCQSIHQMLKIKGEKKSVPVGEKIYQAHAENKSLLYYVPNNIQGIFQLDHEFKDRNYWPQILFYKELYEQYSDSLFILNYRNITNHIKSINNWNTMRQRLTLLNIPGLPADVGSNDTDIKNWMLNHYYNVITYFNNQPNALFIPLDIEHDDVNIIERLIHCGNVTLPHDHWTAKKHRFLKN